MLRILTTYFPCRLQRLIVEHAIYRYLRMDGLLMEDLLSTDLMTLPTCPGILLRFPRETTYTHSVLR